MTSPCEACINYCSRHKCNKRGRITEAVWSGTKVCNEYNDGVDTTLEAYKACVVKGGKMLAKEASGLFTC